MIALSTLPSQFARNRVLGTSDTAKFCGLSVPTIRRLKDAGKLPNPMRLATRKLGWRIGDLLDWQDCREKGLEWQDCQGANAIGDASQKV